jgi:hypothetical protein
MEAFGLGLTHGELALYLLAAFVGVIAWRLR